MDETEIIVIIFLIISIIAVLFQLFVCYFYIRYVNLLSKDNYPFRLIFILSFCDILVWAMRIESNLIKLSTGTTMYKINEPLCVFAGFAWNFLILLNVIMTFLISLSLFLKMLNIDPRKYEIHFYFFSFIYAILFSCVPFFDDIGYGEVDQIKCWVTHDSYRFASFYSHLWIIFILNIIFLCYFFHFLKRKKVFCPEVYALTKKLIFFPIIMGICWTEPSLRRICILANYDSFTLKLLQYIFMPCQGIANAFVYGLVNEDVKIKMMKFLKIKYESKTADYPTFLDSKIIENDKIDDNTD